MEETSSEEGGLKSAGFSENSLLQAGHRPFPTVRIRFQQKRQICNEFHKKLTERVTIHLVSTGAGEEIDIVHLEEVQTQGTLWDLTRHLTDIHQPVILSLVWNDSLELNSVK